MKKQFKLGLCLYAALLAMACSVTSVYAQTEADGMQCRGPSNPASKTTTTNSTSAASESKGEGEGGDSNDLATQLSTQGAADTANQVVNTTVVTPPPPPPPPVDPCILDPVACTLP